MAIDSDAANKGVFSKIIPQHKFQSELEMSKLANSISNTTELFKSVEVLHSNPSKCEIDFEFIEGGINLRQHFINRLGFTSSASKISKLKTIFDRIGRSLRLVHSFSNFNSDFKKQAFPNDFFSPEFSKDNVLIHGDFTLNNIMYQSDSDSIFIIDWSTSPIYDFSANIGPRYWDISFFISSLFNNSFSTYFAYKSREELVKSFLIGYLEEKVNDDLSNESFISDLAKFLKSYNYFVLYESEFAKKNSLTQNFLHKKSIRDLDKFIKELPQLIQ